MIWRIKMVDWQECSALKDTMRRDSRLHLQPLQLNRHPRNKLTAEAPEYADICMPCSQGCELWTPDLANRD